MKKWSIHYQVGLHQLREQNSTSSQARINVYGMSKRLRYFLIKLFGILFVYSYG